jgi:WD40 repeat protein
MAQFRRRQTSAVARLPGTLLAISLAILTANAAIAQVLYDHPTLVADPGVHTGVIRSVAVDKAGHFAVAGAEDKTVRVWSLAKGKLLQTIHMPAGPGNVGKVYAVAMINEQRNHRLIAVGGWASGIQGEEAIYFFDRSGRLIKRIGGLPDVANKLVFSNDGRYLVAALGDHSLHVYDRNTDWAETFCDTNYEDDIYGITFAEDGRLATASYDAKIRLYGPDFRLAVPPKVVSRAKAPHQIAFSPVRNVLALGYSDAPVVEFLDGDNLDSIGATDTKGISGGLPLVAWSKDGQTLFAAGSEDVWAWGEAGQGPPRAFPGGKDTLTNLDTLPDGGLLIATADPLIKRFRSDGSDRWIHRSPGAGLGNRSGILAVSNDGSIVDFGFENGAKARLRFDVRSLKLITNPPDDRLTAPPKEDGLQVERRWGELLVESNVIQLDEHEWPRTWAMSQDGQHFIVGGKWSLRARDANFQRLWRRDVPGSVWAVNITGDGRLVVAAYDDGTIRWHDMMDSGRELLALMILPEADKTNWVAWTPEGFYGATTGAFGVLQWLINHGPDAAGTTVRVSDVQSLHRPEVLALALQERGIGAVGVAEAKAAREEVQLITGAAKAPGARLHVLAIGVNEFGLKFAEKDARELTAALVDTQDITGPYRGSGGLYAEVKPQLLVDGIASGTRIFSELETMQRAMAVDDTAIVMFAGHGMMVGNRLYLVPNGIDATNLLPSIKSLAVAADRLQEEVEKLADHGRVLVLLDACHSGAFNADELFKIMAKGNVAVITSSKGAQPSVEDVAWQHGAFTKVLLEALSGSNSNIDTDHNGVISLEELVKYLDRNLFRLTKGAQQLGMASSFLGNLFVTGLVPTVTTGAGVQP